MHSPGQVVLVVDDHPDIAEVISEALLLGGIVAHVARTGLDALRIYDLVRPALVITDERLVGTMSGSDLLRVLRRKYGDAVGPALFVTGLPELVTCLPGDVVLEKPVGSDQLLATVQALLGGPPAAREAY
jgi:DNA-binding response OmpR family regulator